MALQGRCGGILLALGIVPRRKRISLSPGSNPPLRTQLTLLVLPYQGLNLELPVEMSETVVYSLVGRNGLLKCGTHYRPGRGFFQRYADGAGDGAYVILKARKWRI